MGSLSIWHWLDRDRRGDAAVRTRQDFRPDGRRRPGIKAFKKGMAEDDNGRRPSRSKSIDQKTAAAPAKTEEQRAGKRPLLTVIAAERGGRRAITHDRPPRWLELIFMFDIGWSELVVIGVVALIAIGPKELPTVLRTLGQYMGKLRRMASEFQAQFQEAIARGRAGRPEEARRRTSSRPSPTSRHRSAGECGRRDRCRTPIRRARAAGRGRAGPIRS